MDRTYRQIIVKQYAHYRENFFQFLMCLQLLEGGRTYGLMTCRCVPINVSSTTAFIKMADKELQPRTISGFEKI